MRSIILQYSTIEQINILDLSAPINKKYADRYGFEQIVDYKKRCFDRFVSWEKIAYLNEVLSSVEDDSLVVWVDSDCLLIGNEDLHTILPQDKLIGMVQLRGGIGSQRITTWCNAGVIAMKNTKIIREFFANVWNRNTRTDEAAINAELEHLGKTIPFISLNAKWNCFKNNAQFCQQPIIQSFHGMPFDKKLLEMHNLIERLYKNKIPSNI